MPDLNKILQTIRQGAGLGELQQASLEPLIQMEKEDVADTAPLIESAGDIKKPIRICFAGVGTCGVNIVMSLKAQNEQNESSNNGMVDFVGINSDGDSIKELEKNGFKNNIALSTDSHGTGAGGDISVGREMGEKHYEDFKKCFKQVDLALVVTGMGGGTGTGAAPWVAKAAKEAQKDKRNALTIGITTMPSLIEADRFEIAEQGIEEFRKHVDALIVIDQMNISDILEDEDTSTDQVYELVDLRFQMVLQSILDTVTKYTKINIDFADVCTTLKNCGDAIITTVEAESENIDDIKKALEKAINDKLLFDHAGKVASRLLVYHFFDKNYSNKKHFEVVSEVQKLFGWTKKERGHGVVYYSCDLEDVKPQYKKGNGSSDEFNGKTKVIVMAGGFVEKNKTKETVPSSLHAEPANNPVTKIEQTQPTQTMQTIAQPAQPTQQTLAETKVLPAVAEKAEEKFSIEELMGKGFSL